MNWRAWINCAPQQLWQLVSDVGVIAAPVERAIDLGCGTGLVGVAFRGLCQHLVGVDLSGKMIDQATRKQVYDALHEGDVVDFLQQTDQTFDLFLSADTLIYLGYLSPLLHNLISPGIHCRRQFDLNPAIYAIF
jgi:predicted TPR repeat methyltransferase